MCSLMPDMAIQYARLIVPKLRCKSHVKPSGCAGVRKQWDSIKICKNAEGSPCLLGQGRYGKVMGARWVPLGAPLVATCHSLLYESVMTGVISAFHSLHLPAPEKDTQVT